MRTTLTIDPDVAQRLEAEIRRRGKTLKDAVNDALRIGLGMTDKPVRPKRFIVAPHAFGVRAGVELDRLNQLADELEAEEVVRKQRRVHR